VTCLAGSQPLPARRLKFSYAEQFSGIRNSSPQAQVVHSIDQLAASQVYMTRALTEMQTVELYILDKISTPTAAVPNPALRQSQVPTPTR
jgi:hypothetical protein